MNFKSLSDHVQHFSRRYNLAILPLFLFFFLSQFFKLQKYFFDALLSVNKYAELVEYKDENKSLIS